MKITVEMTKRQAWDLAQFVKRAGWQEFRQNAASEDEAYRIKDAIFVLQDALTEAGYAPR
ncbi:MAG: hypothetical protein GY862_13370 [Gammaproteobacteria bacterium]|nr:hypothetical protein [Gammaproteobacteria bacterium]